MDTGYCSDLRPTNNTQVKLSQFSLSFLCSWMVLYSPCVYPAVTPDGVSATNVTTISGVPIVGIVAPTAGGVSHNTFETFDVGLEGVVINNSLNGGISALSGVGAVGANVNFTGASASIILNEVTSNINRSSLLGTTEIFGDNATYILANPNGITCNGCGFIRTPTAMGDTGNLREVILSTSDGFTLTPAFDLNDLSIVMNSPADIVIGPGGLDISNVDVTTLFTRTLNVDGLISAANNRLQMLLGTGSLAFDAVLPEDRTFTSTQSNDGTVTVAIDATVAGAMNAGQIYIMATEEGVGVTLDNDLISSMGDVELTANGDIVYRNINASNSFNVTTNGVGSTLSVNGATVASNDINWNLVDDVAISTGAPVSIDAGNVFNINCSSGNCEINSQDEITLNAAQVTSNANITTTAGNNLTVNANINTSGNLQSGNNLLINAPAQIVTNDMSAAGDMQLTANTISGNDLNAGGELIISATSASNTNDITATDAITINAASVNANNVQTGNALSVTTTGNTVTANMVAVSSISIDVASLSSGDIQTNDALLIASSGNVATNDISANTSIDIDSSTLNAGDVQSDDVINITTVAATTTADITALSDINVEASTIAAANINGNSNVSLNASSGNITTANLNAVNDINVTTQAVNADLLTSAINSGNDVNWQLAGSAQLTGNVSAGNAINFNCTTPDCTVNANNALQLDAQDLNTQANIQTANNQNLTINANLQSSGDISSGNRLQINASNGDINSSGSISANQNIELTSATDGDITIDGSITSGNDFIISGEGNYNHNDNDTLNIAGNWIIDTHSLTNNDTLIATDLQNGVFRVDEFTNNGLFQSDGPLTVQVDDLLTNNGVIASLEGVVKINHSQNEGNTGTINNNGIISAINLSEQQQPENTLIINPQSLIDDYIADILAGKQRTSQDLVNNINAANLETLSQLTAGTGALGSMQIHADTLNNNAAAIINATQITLDVGALNNLGGLISATENVAINGDTLSNSNAASLFGVITARYNIDIVLNNQFDNEGVIESTDIVIDAPIQNNNSSELVLNSLVGENISTATSLTNTASQQWFRAMPGSESYYQYNEASDGLALIDSNLSQLTDSFLAASGANVGGLPIVGDDLFLAQLLSDTLRANGDIPFVTNDRNNLAQLSTLYNNTLDYMEQANLSFGQSPNSTQRQTLAQPVIVFEAQTLSNGTQVFAPTLLLPNSELNTNVLAADQLNSRIVAHNELLLKSEQITNSGDLIAGNNLIIDTIDLTLTTTARNWFVNDEGEVKYHGAMISSPSLAVTVSGNYVQKGGQLITDTPLIIEAENIDIAGIDVQSQGQRRTATAKLESSDALYLLAKQRLNIGSNALLISQTDTLLSAGQALSVNGKVQSGRDLTLLANQIRVGESVKDVNKNTPASLLAQGNLLMQSETSIDLGYADILASSATRQVSVISDEDNAQIPTGNIVLLAQDGYINSQNTSLTADNNLTLSANNHITTRKSQLNAKTLTAQGANLNLINTILNSSDSMVLLAEHSIALNRSTMNSGSNIDIMAQTGDVLLHRTRLNTQGDTNIVAVDGAIFNALSELLSLGDITQQANDITVSNTSFNNTGSDADLGATSLLAKNNLISKNATFNTGDLNLFAEEGNVTINRSKLNAKGDMTLSAGDNVLLNSSSLNARTNTAKDEVTNNTLSAPLQEGALEKTQPTTSGNIIILADTGDIINTTGSLSAQNSGYMKAGGNIINRSTQTVHNKKTSTNRKVITDIDHVSANYDDDYVSGYDITTTTVTDTKIEGQYVTSKVATINTGKGGLTQIAGGNILNEGGTVKTAGDLYQQAEGSIKNTTLIKRFTENKVTTQISATENSTQQTFGKKGDNKTASITIVQSTDGVSALKATTQAGGNITQIAGKNIINTAGEITAGKDLYQKAEGDVKNLSVDIKLRKQSNTTFALPTSKNTSSVGKTTTKQDVLLIADSNAGNNLIVKAKGNYVNTGNIRARKGDIDITAKNIINTRLTRTLDNTQQIKTENKNKYWGTDKVTTTTTTGRQQVLDTGRVTAGGNIILNASNKITDTAGRYTAGTNGNLKNADGNAIKGGIYANAINDIDMKAIKWTERDDIQKTQSSMSYDYSSDEDTRITTTKNAGYNTTDKIITGNLSSAGHTSLRSEQGDLNLTGTDIKAGQQIALEGRNIKLNAIENKQDEFRKKTREQTQITTITHDVVTLNANEGITLTTTGDKALGQGNLATQGVKLNAGSSDSSNVIINATGDVNLDGVNDEVYTYNYKKKKRSWGRSKTTITENRDVTLNETEIKGGGNLLVNVEFDDLGQPIGKNSGTVTLNGTNVNMGQNAVIYGEEGVNILSGIEYSYARKETHKSGFGGFSKSGSTYIENVQRLGHAEITTGGDTVLLSKNNINVVAGKLTANNITADAGFGLTEAQRAVAKSEGNANVNIIGDKEALSSFDHKYKRNIKLSLKDDFLSIAEDVHKKDWKTEENVIGSVLNARKNINLRAVSDINIIGSELSAANNIKLKADSNVNILAALDSAKDKTETSRERIGIEVKVDSNGIKAFAGREQQTITDKLDISGVKTSTLQAGNNVNIKAGGDINQRGSDVIALNDISYNADGAIRLDTATSIETVEHTEFLRRDGVSAGLQHNFDATKDAVKNMGKGDNGVSKVSNTLQAIDSVDSFVSGPTANAFAGTTTTRSSEARTSELARGSSVQAGGNVTLNAGTDIDVVGSAIVAALDIDLSAENVTIAAIENQFSQTSSFRTDQSGVVMSGQKNSASIGLSDSYSKQRSNQQSASSQSSLLSAGNNTNITAKNDIKIKGSDVNANNNITLDAGRDVLIQAHSTNTITKVKGDSGGAEFGIAATVGTSGVALGVYGSANAANNNLDRDGAKHRNSQLSAGNALNITSGRDTTLRGANAEAEHVELDVGRNFTLASTQDTGNVDGEQRDINARVVVGAGASGSVSVGYGETSGSKAWVNQQTTLISRDKLDVNVNGHTQIDGAVLASKTDSLNLDTNTIAYSDIKDHDKKTSSYLNVGISGSNEKGSNSAQQQNNIQTGLPTASGQQKGGGGGYGVTVSGNYSNSDREQINRATIGSGTITVRNDMVTGNNSIAGINRDVTKAQEITKDENSSTQIYASDSSINAVSDFGETLDQWQDKLGDYAISTTETYQLLGELGNAQPTNAFESIFVDLASGINSATDIMGTLTGGLSPSVENHGGLIAQVPALAVGDQQFDRIKVPLKFNAVKGQMEIDIENLKRIKDVVAPGQDDYVFTNGIQNSFEEAARNGAMQTGAEEFILAYNPEHGLLGDLLESAWDVNIGGVLPSGNARQLGDFYREGIQAGNSFNIAAHSQGTLLNYRSMDDLDFSNNETIVTGTVLFSGSPVYSEDFFRVVDESGFIVKDIKDKDTKNKDKRVIFQINRPIGQTSFFGLPLVDAVADSPLFGGNYNYDGTTNGFWGSILSIPVLFTDDSPHSNYLCQGITCGSGSNQVPLKDFRDSGKYITPTYIEPK